MTRTDRTGEHGRPAAKKNARYAAGCTIRFVMAPLLFGAALSFLVAGLAFRLGALTTNGWIAATVVGAPIVAAGRGWAAILFLFFATSSALSRRSTVSGLTAKGGRRDATQVLANGGVPLTASLLFLLGRQDFPPVLFAASLAAATADTWATEIGLNSRRAPRHILTGHLVAPGTSGGITPRGVVGALGGALLIAAAASATRLVGWERFPAIALAGVGGAVLDSLLGATVQEVRRCPVCDESTEQAMHAVCGTPTARVRGVQGIDNDAVNLLSAAAAGLVAIVISP